MTVPGWIVDAVRPTADELARLNQPVAAELLEAVAEATAPDEREVDALLRRLRAVPEGRRRLIPAFGFGGGSFFAWGLVLAAASAVAIGSVLAPPAPAPPAPEILLAPGEIQVERPQTLIVPVPDEPARAGSGEPPGAEPPATALEASSPPSSAASRTDKASSTVDPLPTAPPETLAVLSSGLERSPPPVDDEDVRNFTRIQESIDMNSAPTTTLHLTELFLQRHPDSPLAEEAIILRLELLAQTAPPRQAMAALDGWLGSHADHAQFLRLLEVRANIARNGMRNCRTALNSYRTLASRARGARKARALAFGGLCALSEGLDDEARESLTAASEDAFLPENLRFEVTEALAHIESMGRVVPLRRAQ